MARGPMMGGRPGGGRPGGGGPRGRMMIGEKPKDAKGTIKRIVKYIGTSRYLLLSVLLFTIFTTLLSLVAPTLQGFAIDCITLSEGRLNVDFQSLFFFLIILGIVYVVAAIFTYLQALMSARLSQYTVHRMRNDLFQKIVRLPISYIDSHPYGDIMSRMTNDVENISNSVSSSLSSLFSGVLTIVGCLVIMLIRSPILTVVSIIAIPLSIFCSNLVVKRARKYFTRQQALLGQLNGHVEESVTGYKTISAYSQEENVIEAFGIISKEYKDCSIHAQILGGLMGPIMNFIGNFIYLLIAGIGGAMAINGMITVGVIQSFLIYSKQFSRPINQIANQYTTIQTAIAGAERVFAIMDTDLEIDEGTTHLPLEEIEGNIRFDHIFFSYKKGEPVLKGFDLDVKKGQKIAIVGATGSGKTTVVNLLMRFYEIDSGAITLDGIDIRDIPKDELRHAIAIVLQDTVLFSDTIKTNIGYGKLDATLSEVEQAAKTANADVFIEQLPEGYMTQLSESGSNLSQGQRQLLSIARAVLADPKILILDEATSSVDTRTEMNIQKAMIALMKGRTSLIIAHRLSTIRDADMIIVVNDGVICESGNHEELLAKKGHYYQLYQNQFVGRQI